MDSSPLTLVVQPSGRVVEARPGDLLLDVVRDAGLLLEAICGGAGECGKCRVVVTPPDAVEETGGPVRHALPRTSGRRATSSPAGPGSSRTAR